jgi:hypothetical protein
LQWSKDAIAKQKLWNGKPRMPLECSKDAIVTNILCVPCNKCHNLLSNDQFNVIFTMINTTNCTF